MQSRFDDMSQEQLTNSISGLNLDAAGNGAKASNGKKSRRPNRAYHNLSPGYMSNPSSTSSFPSVSQLNTSIAVEENLGVPSVFTPKQFSSPTLENPLSLLIGGASGSSMDLNSAVVQPNYNALPIQNMSRVLAAQRWEDQMLYLKNSFDPTTDAVPPLATTQFYCPNQGSCDPRLMSLSMYKIPSEEHKRSATKLPLGLTVHPFATLIPEEPIPLVTMENGEEPLRCRRCRAYVCPNFEFSYNSSFICSICHVKMNLTNEQFSPLGPDGKRFDYISRPELSRGCVDFLVPETYNAIQGKENIPLHYVFLIDVSVSANANGACLAAIDGIKRSIEYIRENQSKCKVAIICYDSKLKFYNLKPGLEIAEEYIVTEVNDIFLPFFHGLFASPSESMYIIDETLNKISQFVTQETFSHVQQNCFGSALEAAKMALEAITGGQGGKIISTLSSIPLVGNGHLKLRKDDASKKSLKPENDFYTKLALLMVKSYISLDLYITASEFVDMASIAYPVHATSGDLKYYPQFRSSQDHIILAEDLLHNVSSIVGYQAQLKLRSSDGLSVASYYSEGCNNSDNDPIIPVITKNTTMNILFKYNAKLKKASFMHFQASLLYTDVHGVRKVRSINTRAPVSSSINSIFKYTNQNVTMRVMINEILVNLGDCNFTEIRKLIDEQLTENLTQYKALISGNSASTIVLPDTLKTLPTYMLSFQKSELMKPNVQSTRGNQRVYDLFKNFTFNQAELSYKLYPQIIPLHVALKSKDLSFYDSNFKFLQIDATSLENLTIQNCHNKFVNGGCYLIFNGEAVYIWFNENTNRILLKDLFAVDVSTSINQISFADNKLPSTGSIINKNISEVIRNWCKVVNRNYIPLIPLRPNIDMYYSNVMSSVLVEDQTMTNIESLDKYLVSLDRNSQTHLSNKDFVKESSSKDTDHSHQKFVQF